MMETNESGTMLVLYTCSEKPCSPSSSVSFIVEMSKQPHAGSSVPLANMNVVGIP